MVDSNHIHNNSDNYICFKYNIGNDSAKVWKRNLMHMDDNMLTKNGTNCVICWENVSYGEIHKCKERCSADFCFDCWYKCMLRYNRCPHCRIIQNESINIMVDVPPIEHTALHRQHRHCIGIGDIFGIFYGLLLFGFLFYMLSKLG